VVPAAVQFVDIAGLVRGASKGEGRGNSFLSNIRETIEFELALTDLGSVEKRLDKARRAARTGDKLAATEAAVLEKALTPLTDGRALWHVALSDEERTLLVPLQLLTLKPILVVRAEGKEYVVQDGDVLLFRFNV